VPLRTTEFSEHLGFERDFALKTLLPSLPSFDSVVDQGMIKRGSRGIVFTAKASGIHLDLILRTLRLFDEQNAEQLPVEVWFSESKVPDSHPLCSGSRPEVRCRKIYDPEGLRLTEVDIYASGYAFCIYAIALSSFQELIFLDNDAAPLRDISNIFSNTKYLETKQLFYADLWGPSSSYFGETAQPESPCWNLVDLEPYPTREMESSVLVIDKEEHWDMVNLVLYWTRFGQLMERRAPRGYQAPVWGDKDLWRLASLFLRKPFWIGIPVELGASADVAEFERVSIGQIDPDDPGRILFVHQPKVLDAPRLPGLEAGYIREFCPKHHFGPLASSAADKPVLKRCTFAYSYTDGALEYSSAWQLHKLGATTYEVMQLPGPNRDGSHID